MSSTAPPSSRNGSCCQSPCGSTSLNAQTLQPVHNDKVALLKEDPQSALDRIERRLVALWFPTGVLGRSLGGYASQLIVLGSSVCILTMGGLVFGFSSLYPVLYDLGVFRDACGSSCDNDDPTRQCCDAQVRPAHPHILPSSRLPHTTALLLKLAPLLGSSSGTRSSRRSRSSPPTASSRATAS